MTQLLDLSGKRFGRLEVTHLVSTGKRTIWHCKCDCGNELDVWSSSLVTGATKSCGCLKRDVTASRTLSKGESALNRLIRQYKKHALSRGISFELTKEQFLELTKKDCLYCGIPPYQVVKSDCNTGDYVYNGIDRLDSTKGYTIENCVPCCHRCNRAKSNYSYNNFYEWVSRVYISFVSRETENVNRYSS